LLLAENREIVFLYLPELSQLAFVVSDVPVHLSRICKILSEKEAAVVTESVSPDNDQPTDENIDSSLMLPKKADGCIDVKKLNKMGELWTKRQTMETHMVFLRDGKGLLVINTYDGHAGKTKPQIYPMNETAIRRKKDNLKGSGYKKS